MKNPLLPTLAAALIISSCADAAGQPPGGPGDPGGDPSPGGADCIVLRMADIGGQCWFLVVDCADTLGTESYAIMDCTTTLCQCEQSACSCPGEQLGGPNLSSPEMISQSTASTGRFVVRIDQRLESKAYYLENAQGAAVPATPLKSTDHDFSVSHQANVRGGGNTFALYEIKVSTPISYSSGATQITIPAGTIYRMAFRLRNAPDTVSSDSFSLRAVSRSVSVDGTSQPSSRYGVMEFPYGAPNQQNYLAVGTN